MRPPGCSDLDRDVRPAPDGRGCRRAADGLTRLPVLTPVRPEPRWLKDTTVLAIHAQRIERFGGAHGVRDQHLVLSALARPQRRWHYDASGDLADLAATLEWLAFVRVVVPLSIARARSSSLLTATTADRS